MDGVEMNPQCSEAGVLSAPLRESDLPQTAQAGGSEGSGVPCESTLLFPGIDTRWGLGPTAHTLTLTLPSLLSCNCRRNSFTILSNSLSISHCSLGDFLYLLLYFRGGV